MTEFLAPSARFLYSNTESEMSQDDETLKKVEWHISFSILN